MKSFLIFLLLIFSSNILECQNFPFREYSVMDGLPQSQVNSIIQDSRGFLWIATRNGLTRFDGVELVNYFRKDGLPSNAVDGVIEDKSGNIWALSNEGLSRYSGFAFDFKPVNSELKGWKFSGGFTSDNNNNVIILGVSAGDTLRRLIVFNTEKGYSDYAKQYPSIDTMSIINFHFDTTNNQMLLITDHHLFWSWKDGFLFSISSKKFSEVFSDRGNLLARSNDTLFTYINKRFDILKLNAVQGRSEAKTISNPSNTEMEFFDGKFTSPILIPFNFSGFKIDNENGLWFPSEKNLYHLLSTAFRAFSEEDIGTRNIWAIANDKNGHIWFGSLFGTLIEFDGKKFRERSDYKKLFNKGVGFYKGSRTLSNGETWFSTNMGVLIWDGNHFSRLKGIPDNTQICYIYEDSDSKLVMLGTEKGLFILRNGRLNLLPDFIDDRLGVIEGVAKDDIGGYWLSGHRGIVRFDGKNSIQVRENVLPQGYTYTIEKDNFGGLWVTSEEGLYFRGKTAKSFIHGLPEAINRPANSISLVDSIHILIGRVADICLIDLSKFYRNEKNYFRIYDKYDGFLGEDCIDNGIVKDQQGRFWILNSDGVVILNPDRLKQNPVPPKVHITGFYYQTDSLDWIPIDSSQFFYQIPENIRLRRNQNKVQISFTGISTTNPEKVILQYRLDGYDEKWSLPSNKRFVVYEKLPPGNYRFHVKATNADGVESSEPLTLEFRVLPSFFQRTGIQVIVLILSLLFTVTVTLFFMKRSHRKKEDQERLESELSRLQMSSVLNQFDPHFTFNVISSVGAMIMKGEKESAYDYITKLSGLLRTVLSDGSLIIKPISEEIDFVRKYCELQKLRFKDRFRFNIILDENIDLQREIPKMLIQSFVENAIKHGFENRKEGGSLEIVIRRAESELEIIVRDNGVGRVAAIRQRTNGTGHGLKIVNSLFEVMNANNKTVSTVTITDLEENDKPSGTEVRISIPDDYRFEFGKSGKSY